ncbi:MAG TPA: ATP synthase F1 subunit gamma [Bacteroidetes bacterium]|nr:ATP synthase F1 subunit gamma [Bacteroidota bacterium]
MANLRDIRDRIASVKNTQQITKAMKMVAAARLKKAQDRVVATRPYAASIAKVIGKLASEASSENPYLRTAEQQDKILLIIVSSDRGLCGGFNTNLFRFIEDQIKTNFSQQQENGTLELVCIGRKSFDHFRKRGYNVKRSHVGFFDKLQFDSAAAVMRTATQEFLNSEHDAVYLAFNEFKSVITQNRVMTQLLPLDVSYQDDTGDDNTNYIYEPSAKAILESIIPLHLNTQIWKATLESNASEHGARMAAMDNATENASEIMRQLKLKYNQARQAAITTEISEIVSGAEALSN